MRPQVIGILVSSLDSRIDGSFFRLPGTAAAATLSRQLRQELDCDAVLNGAVTCSEIYASGYIGTLPHTAEKYPRQDWRAETDLDRFVVCIDPEGTLAWNSNLVERSGQPQSHVIEVLTEAVSDDYLGYLRKRGISYLFAGKDTLDLNVLMEKLLTGFGIRKVLVTGGGVMDWSLLKAGLLDELVLFVVSAAEGSRAAATVFDASPFAEAGAVPVKLVSAEVISEDILKLVYRSC